jgi:hypothetical protein
MKSLRYFLLISFALVGLCSCQSSSKTPAQAIDPASMEQASGPGRDSAELAYALANKTWCSNDDAASLILLLADGQDAYPDFDRRRAALASQGIMTAAWNLRADEPVTKGTLAYMLCRTLKIEGGLMYRLAPCRRYAYREVVYQGLMMRGGEDEPLTGPEVVGIMSRAGQLKAGQALRTKP